jgi:hypothetical protein
MDASGSGTVNSAGGGAPTAQGTGGVTGSGGATASQSFDSGVPSVPQLPFPDSGTWGQPPADTQNLACGTCANVLVPTSAMPLPNGPGDNYTLGGCCVDDRTCGVDNTLASQWSSGSTGGQEHVTGGCQALDQPGVPDRSCVSLNAPGGYLLAGCCRPDGTCGTDMGFGHMGCVQQLVYYPLSGPDGGPYGEAPPPSTIPCDYETASHPSDAGGR